MGFDIGVKEILLSGGVTLLSLIVLSIYSLALIWERWRFHGRSLSGLNPFLEKVRATITAGNLGDAVAVCKAHKGLASSVVMAALVGPTNRDERKRSALRAAERGAALLDKRVNILGTIASTAPFIGLFGTVVGVMRAFKDLAGAAGAGPGVVAIGISEALVCTATGLVVAIPAVWAYNYFNARSSRFLEEMSWISEEILESLSEKAHR
jgi:biopolymer transport protein ExbB/TolQ